VRVGSFWNKPHLIIPSRDGIVNVSSEWTRVRGDDQSVFGHIRRIGKRMPTRCGRPLAGTTKPIFLAPRQNRREVSRREICPLSLSNDRFRSADNLPVHA
jgi:hypothetical protein